FAFFLQAADGLRDRNVTGVQTCALPIFSKVPPTLHTPLMSGANAISGITIIGALVVAGHGGEGIAQFIGFLAIVFATINVVGGFIVTDRMLEMFKKKED